MGEDNSVGQVKENTERATNYRFYDVGFSQISRLHFS